MINMLLLISKNLSAFQTLCFQLSSLSNANKSLYLKITGLTTNHIGGHLLLFWFYNSNDYKVKPMAFRKRKSMENE